MQQMIFPVLKRPTSPLSTTKKANRKPSTAVWYKLMMAIAGIPLEPINTIMGFAEVLEHKVEKLDKEKHQTYIRYISKASRKTYQFPESLLEGLVHKISI